MQRLVNEETPQEKALGHGFKPQEILEHFDQCMIPSKTATKAAITLALGDISRRQSIVNAKLEREAKKVEQAVVTRILARAPAVPNKPIRAAGAPSHMAILAGGTSRSLASFAPRNSISLMVRWKPGSLPCLF